MAEFRYEAIDRTGARRRGQVQGDSREQAIKHLQGEGLLIVELRPASRITLRRSGVDARQIAHFTEQLATLLEAGQPLESALALQARQTAEPAVQALFERLLAQVKGGASLSAAMARETTVFSAFYLSMVRAGEASGTLAEAMEQLAAYLERARNQRTELISALIYPAFLVIGVLGSLVLLLTYVVPQFVPVFADLNIALPVLTQAILWLGESLSRWGAYLAVALLCIGWGIGMALRAPGRRLALDAWVLKVRGLGAFVQATETARLALTLGTLLDKRVSLLTSMEIASQVASNRAMRAAMRQAAQDARQGEALASALARTGVFAELTIQMIRVGEQSGRLSDLLLRLARIYDKSTQTSIKRFMAALVPTLTLVMTVLVAVIMLAILMPLSSLTSSI
ncbi:type II secretion system F family protein [Pseudomonas sp. microsymbiont 2]